jgi:cyclase
MSMNRKTVSKAKAAALAVAAVLGAASIAMAAQPARQNRNAPAAPAPQAPNFDAVQIKVLQIRDNIYMLVGQGGNITLQVGEDGVLIVDTQFAPLSDKILTEIRKISKGPIRFIINTHGHGDHTGGNGNLSKAGASVAGGNMLGPLAVAAQGQGAAAPAGAVATILAHENVLTRMQESIGGQPPAPSESLPNVTYIGDWKDMFFNGESIRLFYEPNAHTDGDSMVYFRRSDVLSVGDIYNTNNYPVIDKARAGSIQGVLKALNHMLEITIPKDRQEGGTVVIPGHGRVSDEADLAEYRDMVTIIHDRIKDMVDRGLTLEQVRAAKPTIDYDPRYGSGNGPGSTDRFIEIVYNDLKAAK